MWTRLQNGLKRCVNEASRWSLYSQVMATITGDHIVQVTCFSNHLSVKVTYFVFLEQCFILKPVIKKTCTYICKKHLSVKTDSPVSPEWSLYSYFTVLFCWKTCSKDQGVSRHIAVGITITWEVDLFSYHLVQIGPV